MGKSIRNALILPPDRFGKRLRPIIDAIDCVHGICELEPIPVLRTRSTNDYGVYRKILGTGKPCAIEISSRGDNIELTFVHEIGHFLKSAAIPGSSFGVRQWASDSFTKGWQSAILASRAAKKLAEILEVGLTNVTDASGKTAVEPARLKYVEYLSRTEEYWGRSYAQYIAIRSRDETLLTQVEARRSPLAPYALQWDDVEFEPIAREFDALFREIGWRS